MRKRNMPPLILICTLIAILCIPVVARGSINTKARSIPTLAGYTNLIEDSGINESERIVLNMLNSISLDKDIYVKYLNEYLSNSEVDLGREDAYEAIDKIEDMIAIMNLEKKSNIEEMSLDGRGVSILLSEQIYKICGLKLVHNIQGDIITISDTTADTFLYVNDNTNNEVSFHLYVLVIILLVLAILLGLCIFITRKNQLYVKDGGYDGFIEKGFA